jgi:hypothetical protein
MQAMQARQQLTMTQAAQAVVWGFGSDVEQHYRKWVAQHYSMQVRTWCLITVFWVLTSILKSAQAGTAVLQAHLPAHLIVIAPYIGSTLVVMKPQTRWVPACCTRVMYWCTTSNQGPVWHAHAHCMQHS